MSSNSDDKTAGDVLVVVMGKMRSCFYLNRNLSGVSSQCNERKQRKQRKQRNEMTSLLDRPITATSDDGVCRWHAAKLCQTRAKLLKLNLICIISWTTSKKRTKIRTVDFF